MTQKSSSTHINCQNCGISQLCLPYTLDTNSLNRLDSIIERKRPYQKGDTLFSHGEPLRSLFAVRSGSFKTFNVDSSGSEQITNFHLPGDLIGFTSIASETYQGYSEALETSMVCEIPFNHLESLSRQLPALHKQILKLMSEEIKQDQHLLSAVNSKSAESRLATFFLELSSRFMIRGLSPTEFRLSMTRNEIGNYLGITVETVSRILSRFQKEQWLKVEGRFIHILDQNSLKRISGVQAVSCPLKTVNY